MVLWFLCVPWIILAYLVHCHFPHWKRPGVLHLQALSYLLSALARKAFSLKHPQGYFSLTFSWDANLARSFYIFLLFSSLSSFSKSWSRPGTCRQSGTTRCVSAGTQKAHSHVRRAHGEPMASPWAVEPSAETHRNTVGINGRFSGEIWLYTAINDHYMATIHGYYTWLLCMAIWLSLISLISYHWYHWYRFYHFYHF